MAESARIRSYYWTVCTRAAQDALTLSRRKGVAAGTAVTVLAAIVAALLYGGVNVGHVILPAVIALAGFSAIVFVVNLIRTPAVLAREAATAADKNRLSQEARITELQAERDKLSRRPVSDRHDLNLYARAKEIHGAVAGAQAVALVSTHAQVAFEAHFPDLSRAVEEWNSALQGVNEAPSALQSRLDTDAPTYGASSSEYQVRPVISVLFELLTAWALDGADRPRDLRWTDAPSGSGPDGEADAIVLLLHTLRTGVGLVVATLPSEPLASQPQRQAEVKDRVERLYRDACGWHEVTRIREARTRRETALRDVVSRADHVMRVDTIYVSATCPACQDNFNPDDSDA